MIQNLTYNNNLKICKEKKKAADKHQLKQQKKNLKNLLNF